MIGTILILIIFVAFIHSLAIYSSINLKNTLRNEAIKIAENCLKDLKSGIDCKPSVSKKINNLVIDFYINAPSISTFNNGLNQIKITVSYNYHQQDYNYTLNSVIYK